MLGKTDRHTVLKLKKENNFNISYDIYDTTFLQYGTELPGGTGTIEKTLCFILPIELNGIHITRDLEVVLQTQLTSQ